MKVMDGKEVSQSIYNNVNQKIKYLYNEHHFKTKKLSVIIIGGRPDSLYRLC